MKTLKAKGEFDYDFKNDILFFKASNREYAKSIEVENMVIDIDKEKFIVGLQIFDASEFFKLSKKVLLKIPHWELNASTHDSMAEIRLKFEVNIRNRIIEKN